MTAFTIGDRVRYRPGKGVYGLEESAQADGRIPGTVVGFAPAHVRVELQIIVAQRPSTVTRSVKAESLTLEAGDEEEATRSAGP